MRRYQKPGQDWIHGVCPTTQLPNMSEQTKSHYGVMVTIEPSYEQGGSAAFQKPFVKIYEVTSIPSFIHCGTKMYLYNMHNTFPKVQLTIGR